MKSKFITKKRRKRKLRLLLFLIMLIIGLFLSYKRLQNSKIRITDKDFINIIVNDTFSDDKNDFFDVLINKTLEVSNPLKLVSRDYQNIVPREEKVVIKEDTSPIIYLYNSHQSEEYASSNYAEFSVRPTVIMNNYILEDIFNKSGYKSIVEESSIKNILNQNSWNYSNSYKASRMLLEQSIITYPSLKYFIDIHRDSLNKDKTTIKIEEKEYAKILFIIGLENSNYKANLDFTEKINNKIDELYPGLSKGIYKKGGAGVNGVYNQDFSGYTILVEIGGYENTTTEVLNSAVAFGKCFLEVINE